MNKVPQVPFYRPTITQAEIDEVVDTLRSGWITTGPKTKQFESEFATYIGQDHAVALNSCTAALHLALEAIGLKAGQTVVVPTMTFAATAGVVRYFDAKPLLVDCRENDFNLDVADAERRIEAARVRGEEIVAIMPVHYGGQIGDVAGVSYLARKFRLKVIEDAAHCCPAYYRHASEVGEANTGFRSALAVQPWKPVGSEADITCFSFYANKPITTGEGGMACTNNGEYAERMRIMSLHGISKDAWQRYNAKGSWYYEIFAPGYRYNLTDIAAAIGLHQLRRADESHRQRARWAEFFLERLGGIEELMLPRPSPDRVHSWHLYAIRLRLDRLRIERAAFVEKMKHHGIGASVHWLPLHMHPYYREAYGYQPQDLPVAARLYSEVISLPIYPGLSEAGADHVCSVVRGIVRAERR